MAELVGINRFPLTGARAESLAVAQLSPAGIVGDRELVFFDELADPLAEPNRLSQKQLPLLATLKASYIDQPASGEAGEDSDDIVGTVKIELPDGEPLWSYPDEQDIECIVNEFGDLTPSTYDSYDDITLGDERSVTETFRDYLGHASLRLARKQPSWLDGQHIDPSQRANAPLHIVTEASVEALRAQTDNPEFGSERFRPGMVIAGDFEPYEEQQWVGRVVRIGDLSVVIVRGTKRCPVPGYDQETGENKKDVPKLYRHLPKAPEDKKPLFGVYGYPVVEHGQQASVALNDSVEVQ